MADDVSIKKAHAYQILAWWHEALAQSEEFNYERMNVQMDAKGNIMPKTLNTKTIGAYASKLLKVYAALMFVFKGYTANQGKDYNAEFENFKPYLNEPENFYKDINKISELETLLSEAMNTYMGFDFS